MKIKNNSGVTITVLVITIIVMLILFGITFSTSTDLLKDTQRNKMKTMLYMVKSRAEILLDDYMFDFDKDDGSTDDLKNVSDANIKSYLCGDLATISEVSAVGFETEGATLPDKDDKIYCSWDKNTLESQGIDTENLAKGDKIIIQYNIRENSVDVASTKGFSKDGVKYYTLSDFSNK